MATNKLSGVTNNAIKPSSFSSANNRGMEPTIMDPYISGYYYCFFIKKPDFIEDNSIESFRVLQNSVSLPDITLNTTEIITGFGGAGKVSHATSVDISTEITMKFTEMSGLPIINTVAQWVQNIRDINTGLSNIKGYKLSEYSGELLVVATKPVLNDVKGKSTDWLEKAFLFTEVYPTNVPFSALNQDLGSSDKVEPDITFKFSGFYHGEKVNQFAASHTLLEDLRSSSMLDARNTQAF